MEPKLDFSADSTVYHYSNLKNSKNNFKKYIISYFLLFYILQVY